VLLIVSFAEQQGLGLGAPWYLLSLLATGYVPWLAAAIGLVWLAVAAQLAALAGGRYAAYPDRGTRPEESPLRALARRGAGAWRRRRSQDEERDALPG
jgi:hypothetical protein